MIKGALLNPRLQSVLISTKILQWFLEFYRKGSAYLHHHRVLVWRFRFLRIHDYCVLMKIKN